MSGLLVLLALLAVLLLGVTAGLCWRGAVLIGDHRALDRLAAGVVAEQRMAAATHATLAAMRAAVQGDGVRNPRQR